MLLIGIQYELIANSLNYTEPQRCSLRVICEQIVGVRYDFHDVFDLSYGRVENINCFEFHTFDRKTFNEILLNGTW